MALGKGTTIEIVAAGGMTDFDATEYATQTYVKVGRVEGIGTFGGSSTVTPFTDLETGDIDKDIGSTDYGTLSVSMLESSADTGQLDLIDGYTGANKGIGHAIKLTIPIGNGATVVRYTYGKISSFERSINDADSNIMVSCNIELTKPVIAGA